VETSPIRYARSHPSVALLAVAVGVVVVACSGGSTERPAAKPGGDTYTRYCALCHGAHGEGYAADEAPALAGQELLASASDAFLARAIRDGRPGTTMSAWSEDHLGPLNAADVDALVALFRTWQTAPTADLGPSPVTGDATRAAPLYAETCAHCHGATGKEGPHIRLANPVLLDSASDGYLRWAIARGRDAPDGKGTPMAAYGGALTAEQIDDLVALIRSWQTPVPPGDVPFPGSLAPVLVNEGGPEPSFTVGQRYTPTDLIASELARGATMAFVDARAPQDYATSHVRRASNVPFYEVAGYRGALPMDHWVVAYCGCPHAESGVIADDLLAHGFTKVTIIDEGFYTWKGRGYPVSTGGLP
jgi:cytochrome c oxidase cbb3-type subunit III